VADTETETPAPPADTPGDDGLVDKVVEKVLAVLHREGSGNPGTGTAADEPASMSVEVRRELARLREEESRQKAADEQAAKIGELSAKVEAIPEKKPREYRRATNMMGWATEADR